MNPSKLILVRHGETDLNKQGRYLGHSNPSLNEQGLVQAHNIAHHLKGEDIDFILSSDLSRALETSMIISSMAHIPIKITPSLREIDFGEWEGSTFEEIQINYPQVFAEWLKDPFKLRIPGGETGEELNTRVIEAWNAAALKAVGHKTLVIVSHGGPLRLLMCHLTRTDLSRQWDFHIGHGEIRILKKDGDSYVQSSNTGRNAATAEII